MSSARVFRSWMVLACCASPVLVSMLSMAQAQAARRGTGSAVPAVLVSDIHFEPFWDPAKAVKLAAAPVGEWDAILSAPDSPARAQSFAELEKHCNAKGDDTSYPLLVSSLNAMRAEGAGATFVTVSGDLIAHKFDCKYNAVFPHASSGEYSAFVVKTIAFVEQKLQTTFPHVPLYVALGNNDSDCGDYQLDARSRFLSVLAPGIASGMYLPGNERKQVVDTFADMGDYNAALPAPFRHTRFIVLDNLFQSKRYASCSGTVNAKPAADQIAWLRLQLEHARRDHEKVWVMAHIPTGVDPYSTVRKMRDVCGGENAEMFLSSDALAGTLAEFGDVIRLAIFAHTHMDELRLLEPHDGASAMHPAVPVKMVSSISPVDGNNPSFTVASVDPETATLVDYRVYAASNKTGVNTEWAKEYDFDSAYHEPAFTAATITDLIGEFRADSKALTPASQNYLHGYFVGDESRELKPFWPQYVCALANDTSQAYRPCVCSSGK